MPNSGKIATISGNVVTDSGIDLSTKADLVDGLIPSTQLPSYVDDVLEFANQAAFPATGETGKIYVALDNNRIFRWSGSTYIEISPVVGVSGTTNYVPKFTSASALGNSQIFDNGTNVGVSTTTPLRKLHVVGNFAVNSSGTQYYGVFIDGVGEGANPNILIGDWHNASASLTWDSTNRLFRIDSQYSTAGAPIVFSGNDAAIEYLRITSTGNVGIGTAGPQSILHVSRSFTDSTIEEGVRIERQGLTTWNGNRGISIVFSDTANATLTSALVGIRTNPTGHYLGELAFRVSNSTSTAITSVSGLFEAMRINSSGNVGIGTASPNQKLTVVGNINMPGGGYSLIYGTSDANTRITGDNTSGSSFLDFRTAGSTRLYITDAGEVLVNTTTDAGAYALQVAGSIYNTTGAVFAASSGEVGIGTTSPSTYAGGKLTVLKTSGTTISSVVSTDAAAGAGIYLQGSDASNNWFQIRQYSASATGTTLGINNAGSLLFFNSSTSTGALIMNQQAAQPFVFGTNNTERMRITSAGELLIGTTSDAGAYALQVAGSIYNTTGAVLAASSGDVGIGTASPSRKLDVSTTGDWQGRFISTNDNGGIIIENNAAGSRSQINLKTVSGTPREWYLSNVNGNFSIRDNTATTIPFFIAGTTPDNTIYLNSLGNVGIGTATPSWKLTVAGADMMVTNGTANISVTAASNLSRIRSNNIIAFDYGASLLEAMRINTDGELLIGTTTDAGAYALQVTGSIYNTTGAVLATSSGGLSIGTTTTYNNYILNYAGASIPVLALQNASTGSSSTDGFQLSSSGNLAYIWNYENAAMLFGTNATERMRITSGGNVLVGTTTDQGSTFQVSGNAYLANGRVDINANHPFGISLTRSGPIAQQIYTGSSWIIIGVETTAGGLFTGSSTNASVVGSGGSTPLQFGTNSIIRATIDTSGNLGIGTASPGAKLEVNGTVVAGIYNNTRVELTSNGIVQEFYSAESNPRWRIHRDLLAGGQSGIGFNDAANTIAAGGGAIGVPTNRTLGLYTSDGSSLQRRLTITPDGEVLIGTTTDVGAYNLQVSGNAYVSGKIDVASNVFVGLSVFRSGTSVSSLTVGNTNSTAYLMTEGGSAGSTVTGSLAYAALVGNGANQALQFFTNNTVKATITSAGELLIGTATPTSSYTMTVAGALYINNVPTFGSSGNIANYLSNTITIPGSSTFNNGSVWAPSANNNFLTFGGSNTIPNSVTFASQVNVNRISFSAASSTITLTQGSGSAIRAVAALQVLQQTGGTINGTVSHGTSLLIQGVYPTNMANVTYTNYYGLVVNPLDEWGGVTFTNRWGIYQAGSSDKNYFSGRVLIGTTTDNSNLLQVNGTVSIATINTNSSPTFYLTTDANGVIQKTNQAFGLAVSFNRQTASYTMVLADAGKMVEMNVGSANNLTVPPSSSVNYSIGTIIYVSQYGAGQTTIVAGSGVTLRSTNSWTKINAQYGVVSLTKVGTDEWYLAGNLNA